jgi:biopolymer transport protein ExbD
VRLIYIDRALRLRRSSALFSLVAVNLFLLLWLTIWVMTPICTGTGPDLVLPRVEHPLRFAHSNSELDIAVKPNGVCILGMRWVPCHELAARLESLSLGDLDRRILLKGDASAPYADIRGALEQLNHAGYRHVVLIMQRRTLQFPADWT